MNLITVCVVGKLSYKRYLRACALANEPMVEEAVYNKHLLDLWV